MRTVSFSLDDTTIQGIESLAQQSKLSRSDVVRAMYARMRLEKTLEDIEAEAAPMLRKLGLATEDDITRYAKQKP